MKITESVCLIGYVTPYSNVERWRHILHYRATHGCFPLLLGVSLP
ncbi:MAG: hypothetical protein RMI34_12270 [Chloroherpetonaceae bacterium]|nr:hypothetical protein [Chloroherpetonaceae bacterium]MDW8020833.1 hypothetical protein [Chloroherpetonaceae bacterium]